MVLFQSTVVRERASLGPEIHLSCGAMQEARGIPMGELGREIVGGGSHTGSPGVPLVVTPQRAQRRKSFFSFLRALKTFKKS